LEKIIELVGRPSPDDVSAIDSPFAATMLESVPGNKPRRFREVFSRRCSADALDLLQSFLKFSPDKRINVHEALQHPYVAQFHKQSDEPSCSKIITIPIDDNTKLDINEYRERVYHEVVRGYRRKRGSTAGPGRS